jgi:hypothetical protein
MKHSLFVLIPVLCAIPVYATVNDMPSWDSWQGESGSELDSTEEEILGEFIESGCMSFSEFSDIGRVSDIVSPDHPTSHPDPGHPGILPEWTRRMRQWETEVPDIRGFTWVLRHLDLSWMQHSYLDFLTLWVDYELGLLKEYHEIGGIREAFFEEFLEDFYMPVSVYFIWDERAWYEDDVHDLLSEAIGEIHEMLSPEQLEEAGELVEYMLERSGSEMDLSAGSW